MSDQYKTKCIQFTILNIWSCNLYCWHDCFKNDPNNRSNRWLCTANSPSNKQQKSDASTTFTPSHWDHSHSTCSGDRLLKSSIFSCSLELNSDNMLSVNSQFLHKYTCGVITHPTGDCCLSPTLIKLWFSNFMTLKASDRGWKSTAGSCIWGSVKNKYSR